MPFDQAETHTISIIVPNGKRPERLDMYLTQSIENATRNKVQQGIEKGLVLVNGKPTKASYKVAPADHIQITLLRPPPIEAGPEDIPLNIVFEDEFLLIINKPAGMVVHPAYSNTTGTMVNALLHHIKNLSGYHNDPIRPGIVHRIDKDTSGLLVVAKNETIHAKMARDFARHQVDRAYWAICIGVPKQQHGTIKGMITRDPKNRKRFTTHDKDGKHAVTHYEILEVFDRYSLLRLKLETGRTHQIRVHLASIGNPILGDETYNGTSLHNVHQTSMHKQQFKNLLLMMPRQALHAKTLGFFHYGIEDHLSFDSPLPDDFKATLSQLEIYGKHNT